MAAEPIGHRFQHAAIVVHQQQGGFVQIGWRKSATNGGSMRIVGGTLPPESVSEALPPSNLSPNMYVTAPAEASTKCRFCNSLLTNVRPVRIVPAERQFGDQVPTPRGFGARHRTRVYCGLFTPISAPSLLCRHDAYNDGVRRIMPRKIRDLIRDLECAGFANRGGKGSHRNFEHPKGVRTTLSGQAGDDAKRYQEREVKQKIEESRL